MKRDQQIDRLVAVGHNRRELNNLSNVNIRALYDQAAPIFRGRARQAREEAERQQKFERIRKKELAKIQAIKWAARELEADFARQTEWMRRCVRVPFPKIEAHYPPPCLDFGISALLAYAKHSLAKYGDQNAAATLRVLTTGRWGAR